MSARRNPFAQIVGGAEPAAFIPPPASKAKRSRNWEHRHPVVAYRGIPADLQARVKALAGELNVPVGEVVRAMLLHGLAEQARGALPFAPVPAGGKMTLFGGDGA